jgi:cytoskeletal protein RodZ
MAEDFGSYLKSERELRGVTLDELHSKTMIPVRFLLALENNQFDELPEEVFIKGYIRSIAKVIGAQEYEVLSTYMDIKKTAPSIDTNNPSTLDQKHSTLDPKFIFVLSLIILFLSGIAWGINILIHKFNKDSTESIPTLSKQKQSKSKEEPVNNLSAGNGKIDDTSPALTTSELSPTTSAISSKIPIEKSPNNLSRKSAGDLKNLSATVNNEDPASSTESNMPLKLTIRVKGDVWLNIMVDDSTVESFILTKGSEKIFYGKKQYLINAGNKNLIDLTLNGTAINFQNGNKEDTVTNFTINAQLVE